MGASRKLQAEIDRVLKKVQEGVEVFDSIWKKVYDTDNANQKEKFEADLKKEIKKLQRYRDQIKTWIQSSEIKDKKVSASYEQSLMDARKTIEREMERFKICEKETKTKAFSKEGLGQQPKTDPKEKAKSETRDWLNNVVSELENQIDVFEAEMEGLTVKKGKTRPPRLTHLETSIVRHKAHIMKLELILRLLDNDELSPEQVNDVKDFLDDYVERNQEDFDEFDDVDELYSTLPLDKVESLEDLVTIVPPGLVKQGASTLEQAVETALQDSNSKVTPSSPSPKASGITSSAPSTPAGGNLSPGAASASSPIGMPNTLKEDDNSRFPFRNSTPSHAETNIKGVNSGAEERVGNSSVIQPLVSPLANQVMIPQASRAGEGIGSADGGIGGEPGGSANQAFSPSVVPGMQWRPGNALQNQNEVGNIRGRTEIAPDQREKFLQRLQQVQQQGQSNILGMPTIAGGNHKQFAVQQHNPLFQQPQSIAASQPSNQQTLSRDAEVANGDIGEQHQTSEDPSLDVVPNPELATPTPTMAAVAPPKNSVQCFGRKKTAVAVTHCKQGKGLIKINGVPIELLQPEILRAKACEPIYLLGTEAFRHVDMRIRVKGGGHTSQIYAIRQSIAKALVAYAQKFEDEMKKKMIKDVLVRYDRTLLVADPRRCEPKKFGGRGARSRFQKSYR